MKPILKKLFFIGNLEGISFLLLLFIAMPLKYIFHWPIAVQVMGSIHGVLFVAFVGIIIAAWEKAPITVAQCFKAFLLSLLPCGTFFLHKIIKENGSRV